jgi:leucyl/phenylalanyl-tRNA--protein transferase
MPVFLPANAQNFPDPGIADSNGLVAIGGNLHVDSLLNAYRNGIFPWYNENEPICWYSPDPRFVLFPSKIKISNSMERVLRKNEFTIYFDKDFKNVIRNCRMAKRKGEAGTWITDDIEIAYNTLYEKGYAHTAEAYQDNELVGGLYGVQIGKVFFGESMFANKSNASKSAFISYAQHLQKKGIELIDCQVYTSHLESLGAEMIPRKYFLQLLRKLID